MTYIIIKEENIHHEGDERSRQYPGHGYPAWTQTLKIATEFESYNKFYEECRSLALAKTPFKAYQATEMTVTTKVEVEIK